MCFEIPSKSLVAFACNPVIITKHRKHYKLLCWTFRDLPASDAAGAVLMDSGLVFVYAQL